MLYAALNQFVSTQHYPPGPNMGRPVRTGQLTSASTQSALAELVRLLAPARVLEIGTAFADTARVIATAMAEIGAGHLITIDPFGGHRVPGIIAGWPPELRERVTFRTDNSMSLFLYLEAELEANRDKNGLLDIAFVDGHHSFDYAFFDLMRSALFLRPGGALVVDNIEQAGPAAAIQLFLEHHTHWQLFKTDGVEPFDHPFGFYPAANAAIILAPDGIEIGPLPCKVELSNLAISEIGELQVRLRRSAPGLLRVVTNFYARPTDFSVTGMGEQGHHGIAEHKIGAGDANTVVITYEPPLRLSPRPDDRVAASIELSFTPEGHGNLLGDPDLIGLEFGASPGTATAAAPEAKQALNAFRPNDDGASDRGAGEATEAERDTVNRWTQSILDRFTSPDLRYQEIVDLAIAHQKAYPGVPFPPLLEKKGLELALAVHPDRDDLRARLEQVEKSL
jgi:predicted O-methyltransferase YrrM